MLQGGRQYFPTRKASSGGGFGAIEYNDYMIDNQIDAAFTEDKIVHVPRSYHNANIDYNIGIQR